MNKPNAPAPDTSKAPGDQKPQGAAKTPAAKSPASAKTPAAKSPASAKTPAAKSPASAKTPAGAKTSALPKAPRVPARAAAQASAERPEPPRSVLLAVRAMYTGAVVTAIGLIITVIGLLVGGEHALRLSHPHASAARLHATESFLLTIAVVSGLVEIGAWLFTARANRGGLKWARIIATGLFALSTFNFVSHITGSVTIGNVAYSAVMWLIGAVAVYFLWRKESSSYFS